MVEQMNSEMKKTVKLEMDATNKKNVFPNPEIVYDVFKITFPDSYDSQRSWNFELMQNNSEDDGDNADENILILDTDKSINEQIVVHRKIVKHLKAHQIDGICFMYNMCYRDLNTKKRYLAEDHGCILAHCMGLGKTLSVITLMHTLVNYPRLQTNKVLIICPKSMILNWKEEIEKWLRPIKKGRKLNVYTFADVS